MYYLFGIRKGIRPLGNDGALITHYKSERKIKEVAERFATMYKLDEVYLMKYYSQKMCELSMNEFVNYIRKNGIRYV